MEIRTQITILLTFIAVVLVSSFSEESRAEQQYDAEMLGRLTEYLQTDEEGVINRLAQEAEAIELHSAIKGLMGDTYAGAWFSSEDGRLHVATTSLDNALLATRYGATASVVESSLTDLNRLRGLTIDAMDSGAILRQDVQTVSVDVKQNRVSIQHAAGRRQAIASALQQWVGSIDEFRLNESSGKVTLSYDVRGADAYENTINSYVCSIGFSTTVGYFTAGHCGDSNDLVNGNNGQSQGEFIDSTWPDSDLALVDTNSNWTKRSEINGYDDGILNVPAYWGGHIEGLINTTVCRYGQETDGPHCGSITDRDVSVTVSDLNNNSYLLHGLIETDACEEGGDSGGPLITSGNGQAQGTLVGGYASTCPGTSDGSYFEPVTKHMTELFDEMLTGHGANSPTINDLGCQYLGYGNFVCNGDVSSQGITTGQWTVNGVNYGAGRSISGTCTTGQTANIDLSASNPYGVTNSSTSFYCSDGPLD